MLAQLEKDYPQDVRVVYRLFPLLSIHDKAALATQAAEAAGVQGEFWAMHDLLFARQSEWRQHPAGLITEETVAEIQTKLSNQDWARRLHDKRCQAVEPWLAISTDDLRRVFPKVRGNVYHNFSCPTDRCRLTFNALEAREFTCPVCKKVFAPETDAGVYPAGDRYHGTMYDGWVYLFHLTAPSAAMDLGIVGWVEPAGADKYFQRGIEILVLYADTIERLETKFETDR